MYKILMVRHGQASFGSTDYDRLSSLGERQASLLGDQFARTGFEFDVEMSGEHKRQRDTARLVREKHPSRTAVSVDACFNEYDADGVFRQYLPEILAEQPELEQALGDDPYAASADRGILRRLYFPVLGRWVSDRGDGEIESWQAFKKRVVEGLRRIPHARSGRAVVYTSGGVVTAAMSAALDLSPGATLEINWRVFNASVTVIHINDDELAVGSFNNVSHLEQEHPEFLTYL